MKEETIKSRLENYEEFLRVHDMKARTIEKYVRDVRKFLIFLQDRPLDYREVAGYRESLMADYKDTSINSMLVALNGYLKYIGRKDCCVRLLRIQRPMFLDSTKELTRPEYERMVQQAQKEGDLRLSYILQTIGSTGIRVSELPYITVEALEQKTVYIHSKGKIRYILLPATLVEMLREYCVRMKRTTGSIFVTRSGRPIGRQNIWSAMRSLCRRAGISEGKGFPHNLRHLFARTFYEREKDIVRLADYLGHSSVETTRRYTMTSQLETCRQTLELGLLITRISGNGSVPTARTRESDCGSSFGTPENLFLSRFSGPVSGNKKITMT